jgi:hypothetical protein
MMIKERQKYDRDFKQKAVELSFARENAKEIPKNLGSALSYYTSGVENTINMRIIVFLSREYPN